MSDSNVFPISGSQVPPAAPRLLDVLRRELIDALDTGLLPIKLVVRGDFVPALVAQAQAEGVFEDGHPAEILGLPMMMADRLVSVEEGARIVCEGDETHVAILARRREVLA